ncbi:MAG: type II toxin-antitoxin system Phd/YefM family antitoxin [Lachnospiraceae bacterium]|nr:type II toxin-antitoxin system Phd/YefM family antitoxin [Lachnospiraceae bacterium]
MDLRSNLKKFLDMAYDGETIVVPRKERKNVVIISEDEYNRIMQNQRIGEYAARIADMSVSRHSNSLPATGNVKADNFKKLDIIEKLKPGWNGNQAPAIPAKTITKVRNLINALPIQPELFPTALKSIQLEYDNSRHDHMEIEIGESNTAEIFIVTYFGDETVESVSADISSLQERVLQFYG